MTPHIDEFLSRARLVSAPYTQDDVDAAEARVLARLEAPAPSIVPAAAAPTAIKEPTAVEAAQDLQTLCETVVTRTTALRTLRTFLTPQLPEPPGARVLGCILQLAESEENARFWWQYAAGAGDPAASYCLYLHHRALGEHAPARWWHEQTELLQSIPSTDEPVTPGEGAGAEPETVPYAVTAALNAVSTTDASLLPTALRILGALRTGPAPVPAVVGAVLDYAPAAVGYVDGLDLPLTDPDFTDHIRTLIATEHTPTPDSSRDPRRPSPRSRPPDATAPGHGDERAERGDWNGTIRNGRRAPRPVRVFQDSDRGRGPRPIVLRVGPRSGAGCPVGVPVGVPSGAQDGAAGRPRPAGVGP